jgi:hypothetical protein
MGLRHKELEGMILPLISVDEFEPKSGTTEEVIVVAFFANDELPAYDLDDFIDKSVVEFLDSEVSPNPNEEGQYLVFVEFKRQPNFWMKLFNLIEDVENVTGECEWQVQPYLIDELYDLNDPQLQQYVITKEEEYVPKKDFDATVEDYMEDSDLLTFERDESHLRLGGKNGTVVVEYAGFGDAEELVEKLDLTEAHFDLNTSALGTALRGTLGRNWAVNALGDYYFITKEGADKTLAVRKA